MATDRNGLPWDGATPADWRRFWLLVEHELGVTEQQVRAMMERLPLPPDHSTPERYARVAGRRGDNLAHLYSKVRGWASRGFHLTGEARREWERAHPQQWRPIAVSECPEPQGPPLPLWRDFPTVSSPRRPVRLDPDRQN